MTLARRITKLMREPGFRAEPMTVLARGLRLGAAALLKQELIFPLTPAGERMRLKADLRYTSVTAFMLRDWVEPELRRLDAIVRPRMTVVDVGANVGLYALKAARLVGPKGRVIALEPGAEAFEQLRRNLRLNAFGWVEALKQAASDRDGEAVLHHVPLGDDPQAYSLVAHAGAEAGEQVTTQRLDTLARMLGLSRLDVLKIDVEGGEPLVLAGASDVLARLRPVVLFECNAYLNAGGEAGAAQSAWRILEDAGYRFHRLTREGFAPIAAPPADFCNIVATPVEAPPPSL